MRENILFIFRYTVRYPAQLVLAECVRWKLINEWINQWQHKHGRHCASWLSSSESKHWSERGYAVAYKQGCFWLFPLKKQWTSVAQTREQPGRMPNTSTLFLSTSLRPGCSAHVKLTTGEISWHFFFFFTTTHLSFTAGPVYERSQGKEAFLLALNKMIQEAAPPCQ